MTAEKAKESRKKVLIVEDHPIMRSGLAQLIGQESDLVVYGEAEDAHGALEAIKEFEPDIAVVDISLKDSSGIELIKDIKIRWPALPVLVLSMHEESFYAERALRAGAMGYVAKAEASMKVVDGIRKVLGGGVYVSDKISSKMLRKLVGGSKDLDVFPIDKLSDREFEVFELIGQGLQTREVADKLHLSVKTVDAHREHIKRKLKLDSATELLKYAVQWVQLERDG
jgi:DNA-binding NarL/FixJ family response regulator